MSKKIEKRIVASALLCSMAAYSLPVFGYTKEESVYTKLDSDGNAYKTTVSEHLKNTDNSELLKDMSDLLNIENVGGDEEFEKNDNSLTWKTKGEDIYYEGTTEKELPIETKISYSLDGVETSKEDIVGKEGKVKITIQFTNKEERKVNINGTTETMYVPFVVGIGTVIDNENNKNIEITNGKVINNGNKTMVIGIAMPGMQESLDISKGTLEIPESVEIKMDAKNFEMNEMYCFATPKIIDEEDIEIFDNLDEIYGMADELKDASTQLVDGSKQLADGAEALNNGTNQLSDALNEKITAYENAKAKYTSTSQREAIKQKIVAIVNQKLQAMMPEIEAAAEKEAQTVISNHKSELENSTVEVAMKLTSGAVQSKLSEIEKNGLGLTDEQYKQLANSIEKDLETALNNVEKNKTSQTLLNNIKEALINEVKESVAKSTTNAVGKTLSSKIEKSKTAINSGAMDSTLSSSMTKEQQAQVNNLVTALTSVYMSLDAATAQAKAKEDVFALMRGTASATLDIASGMVKDEATNISNQVVDSTISDIEKMSTSNETLNKAIEEYKNSIITAIAKTVGSQDEAVINATIDSIKTAIINEVEKEIKSDAILNAYSKKAMAEVNLTIDSVATSTAKELASTYTQTLANEIANNMVKDALSGELSTNQIDEALSEYEETINNKLNEVDNGVASLKEALNELTNGTEQLSKGASGLSEGMSKFDQEGIEKIYNYVNGDVKDLQTRVEKLQDLANEYNTFTMADGSATSSVKFIMMIDKLGQDTVKKEDAVIQDSNSQTVTKEKQEN